MAQVQRLYNFANGTKSDAEQVDAEFDNLIQGVNTLDNDLNTHKSSGDHDSRYYTKSQTDTQINNAVANVQASKFVETGTSFPSNPTKGQTFYHETEKQFYIYDGSKWEVQKTDLSPLQKEIANLNLQLEASQRVTNGKTFGTDFLNTFGMTIDYTKAIVQGATSAGATTVTVDNATGFQVGQEVTIYDDVKLERVVISNISGNDITFTTSLVNSYKDKANVARTMAILDTINNCLKFGGWATGTTNTVTDATVVASAYDTYGNGGRKLVRLENGWLVAGVHDSTNKQLKLFKSSDNGATWSQMCYIQNGTVDLSRFSLSNKDNFVYVLYVFYDTAGNKYILFNKIDALTVTNTNQFSSSQSIETQTDFGNVSLTINSAGTELHAAWASKNSTYPNSLNIRYVKGTINGDGSVTWGSVEQRTTQNTSGQDYTNPTIVTRGDGYPVIIYQYGGSGTTLRQIVAHVFDGASWTAKTIYNVSSYDQSSPSAIFVPQSVNGLANGRIWVAWHGTDSTDTTNNNIRVSFSDDGGATWSAMQKLTSGNSYGQAYPTITVNKNNELFVLWYGIDGVSSYTSIRMIKYNGSWGSITTVSQGTANHKDLPSSLYDTTLNFSTPLFIYREQNTKVGFYGTWTTITETPLLENDVRFTVSNTDEMVMWVQRDELAGFTINAEVNGNTMTKTSVIGEDQFTYDLNSVQPAEVKLKMTRANTTDDVKITKILGGVA
jgi:hypothetical protein